MAKIAAKLASSAIKRCIRQDTVVYFDAYSPALWEAEAATARRQCNE